MYISILWIFLVKIVFTFGFAVGVKIDGVMIMVFRFCLKENQHTGNQQMFGDGIRTQKKNKKR